MDHVPSVTADKHEIRSYSTPNEDELPFDHPKRGFSSKTLDFSKQERFVGKLFPLALVMIAVTQR